MKWNLYRSFNFVVAALVLVWAGTLLSGTQSLKTQTVDLHFYQGDGISADDFGHAVFSPGDLNKNGSTDLLIGAPGSNSSAGAVYFYDGSTNLDSLPDMVFNGNIAGDLFGSALGSGDFNDDMNLDFVVGVPGYNGSVGKVDLYFGGSLLNTSVDGQFGGQSAGELFGQALSGSDDLNEDGYADIVVGAPGFDGSTGKVYVFYGGEIVDNIPDLVMTGETAGDQFGASLCIIDVNMDGFGDIVVGAPGYNGGNGKLYLYLGDGSIDNQADWVYSSSNPGEGLGSSLNSAGFFNEDGFEDLIAGAAAYNSNIGRAYVFYGNGTLAASPSLTMTGSFPGDNFGSSVSKLDDVNEDDFGDMIIGASGYNSGTGRAYVYYGGNAPDGLVDVTLDGDLPSAAFGSTVASAGDLNADGVDDIVVAASSARTSGMAYLFFGSDLTAPQTPVFMQAIGGNAQADLFWLPNSETDFYRYYIYGDTLADPTVLMDSTSALNRLDTSKTVTGLINGKTYYFRITAKDQALNESGYSDQMQATPSAPAALDDGAQTPLSFKVEQNYPNPFNPTTLVSFTLPQAARVQVSLYNILGQQVFQNDLGQLVKGMHSWKIDGSALSSGIYFYRVTANGKQQFSETRRMLLMR